MNSSVNSTLGLKVSKNFKTEQVEVHSSFVEPVNVEFRLAVFNFFANIQSHLFLTFLNFESVDVNFSGHV